MRLNSRRRAYVAVVISLPIGFLYLFVGGHLAVEIMQYWRGGLTTCNSGSLRLLDTFNGCYGSFSLTAGLLELLALTIVAAAIAWALARWVTWPLRAMRANVEQLGPNSLALGSGRAVPRTRPRCWPTRSTTCSTGLPRDTRRSSDSRRTPRTSCAPRLPPSGR